MFFFFFNDTATTEIYTLSLHDALPIYDGYLPNRSAVKGAASSGSTPVARSSAVTSAVTGVSSTPLRWCPVASTRPGDRKSTRLNSSHANISYAVFCLKKKKGDEVGARQ